jgi:hypothetical protein
MATIKIKREAGFADMLRSYTVVLDGRIVGKLRRGKEMVLDATSGQHELQLKIDWCRSQPVSFSLTDAQSSSFECGNNTKIVLAPFYLLFRPSHYLWLRPTA